MNAFKRAIVDLMDINSKAKDEEIEALLDELVFNIGETYKQVDKILGRNPIYLSIKEDMKTDKKMNISKIQRKYSLSYPKAKFYYQMLEENGINHEETYDIVQAEIA